MFHLRELGINGRAFAASLLAGGGKPVAKGFLFRVAVHPGDCLVDIFGARQVAHPGAVAGLGDNVAVKRYIVEDVKQC